MPIFDRQIKRFKINLSHPFVLKHRENEKHRFLSLHASENNTQVFESPRLINNQEDFLSCLEKLQNTDILEHARQQRPDSKWTVHSVTSTSFCLNHLSEFPAVYSDHPLPDLRTTLFTPLWKINIIVLTTLTTIVSFAVLPFTRVLICTTSKFPPVPCSSYGVEIKICRLIFPASP